MALKRPIAVAILLAPLLASCSGVSEGSLSGYVADHWPHWAGGMPDDVPPRPGAPGYDEFVAHGKTGQDATDSAATNGAAPSGTEKPAAESPKVSFQTRPAPAPTASARPVVPAAAATPSGNPSEDPTVVRGGLY